MIIGLCGAEGAGKTTISNLLSTVKCIKKKKINPKEFVLSTIFNGEISSLYDDSISNVEIIPYLMRKYVDDTWNWGMCSEYIEEVIYNDGEYVEVSFADALKKAASVLFDYDYMILRGDSNRDLRETKTTVEYNICGKLTGRQILTFFGTDIMRAKYNDRIWIINLKNTIDELLLRGKKIIISDVRFINELNFVLSFPKKIVVVVYENYTDLIISDEDHKKHPSKWQYKQFLSMDNLNIVCFENKKTILNENTLIQLKNNFLDFIHNAMKFD